MRLSVSAARRDGLVINIVLVAAMRASGQVDFIFIIFLLSFVGCWFLNLRHTIGRSIAGYGV